MGLMKKVMHNKLLELKFIFKAKDSVLGCYGGC